MTAPGSGSPADAACARVGVLIPTCNRVGFLKEALASVLEQSHHFLSVLVLDDASEDGTAGFLSAITDPRVSFVVNQGNLGLSGSINKGIALLPDDVTWCTVLCDDDRLDPGYLAAMLAAVAARAISQVAYGRIAFIAADGAPVREAASAPAQESALQYLQGRADGVRETYLSGALFNRDAFRRMGGYPVFATGMAADEAFLFALALPAGLAHVAQARVQIRVHRDAESQQATGIPAHLQALREFADFCRQQAADAMGRQPGLAGAVDAVLSRRVRGLNNLLWLRGERFLRKNCGHSRQRRQELVTLNALARSRDWNFSGRIRLNGWCRLLTGFSPESVGFYRYFWEKILKVAPGA